MNGTIKVLTLNIGNPSIERAKKQVNWLKTRTEDIFVLTETKNSEGCNYIADSFSGYTTDLFSVNSAMHVSFPLSLTGDHGVMCISKFPIKRETFPYSKSSQYYCRHIETDIDINNRVLHIVGLYVPSRDQSSEKIERKKVFLEKTYELIKDLHNPSSIICGDFNILDRNHFPHYSFFKNWEYEFYDNLLKMGYVDAFRKCHPTINEYSWVGRTNDGYRYDYCFVSKKLSTRVLQCDFIHETRLNHLTDHSALCIELQC
ncbi:MAG: hypothetical protein IKP68_09120 [Clostridia bacterium]|nr:hypothetical protein [Clostridia bacterium]